MVVENGHIEILKLLIDYGYDINAKNHEGNTPLHIAT
jgi:ankyrin repeat protein